MPICLIGCANHDLHWAPSLGLLVDSAWQTLYVTVLVISGCLHRCLTLQALCIKLLMPMRLHGISLYNEGLSDPLLDDDPGSRAMAACCLCSSQMTGCS